MTRGVSARAAARSGAQVAGPDDPVLISKITLPGVPSWAIRRPQIDKLIAAGARGPLTTVTGPPGSGKTMAIAWWAAARSDPLTLAWVSLDDYDNRPSRWRATPTLTNSLRNSVPRIVPSLVT
jgi:ATP/maltotriose-dependent transcriptional regulator MalT